MPKTSTSAAGLQKQYARLRQSLARIGYISQGSVLDRSKLRRPRFGYQWTRKVAGKTVTVALSQSEFKALGQAIVNERKLTKTIAQMERISRRILFINRRRPAHHKSLPPKVLGFI